MKYKFLDNINSPADIKKLKKEDLSSLAFEIREKILEVLSNNDGHLASSLGVVELTIVLNYIFSMPEDKIVWDVGHQTYSHKIITGRKDQFHTLRKFKGISGFPKPSESIYDSFTVGHSSTSISAALGMAKARDIKGEKNKVIAVIGDGALTGGMALEGLNNAGRSKNFIVILNDNEMSISPNVGALSAYLNKIISSKSYNKVKKDLELILDKIPSIGHNLAKAALRLEESVKTFFVPGVLFEEMGFTYFGPVDGHDIDSMMTILNSAKDLEKPVLLHIVTKKGKGYHFAEKNPESYHGTKPFDIKTGKTKNSSSCKTHTDVFSEEIVKIARKNKKITAITAAMSHGTGLEPFRKEMPERFFDVGIAEQHAITFAGGLAISGLIPVIALYSTFLQRGYDQVVHDIALQNLNVKFMIDRAGIVGEDGPTHHGTFDIAFLRHIPNMIIMQPKNEKEMLEMLNLAIETEGPVALRYPRGAVLIEDYTDKQAPVEIGKSEILKEGKDAYILSLGNMCKNAFEAVDIIEKENPALSIGIVNMRFVKPLDMTMLKTITKQTDKLITLEDHTIVGGMGSAVLEGLNQLDITNTHVLRLGWPDEFIEHGDKTALLDLHLLSPQKIATTVTNFIKKQ